MIGRLSSFYLQHLEPWLLLVELRILGERTGLLVTARDS